MSLIWQDAICAVLHDTGLELYFYRQVPVKLPQFCQWLKVKSFVLASL